MSQRSRRGDAEEVMTPEEIHRFGVRIVAEQLRKEGYELVGIDPRIGIHPQIVATRNSRKAFIAVRTAVYPGNGRFESLDAARALVDAAMAQGGTAYLASVGIVNAAGVETFGTEKQDFDLAGRAVRGAGFYVNYRGLKSVASPPEGQAHSAAARESGPPPEIDSRTLDETAGVLALEYGSLDDLPEELANTVVNCYYRFLRFLATGDPYLLPQNAPPHRLPLDLFEQDAEQSTRVYAAVKDIGTYVNAFRRIPTAAPRSGEARRAIVQLLLDTFKYQIDSAVGRSEHERATERKSKVSDEIEDLYRLSRPMIEGYLGGEAPSR